MTTLLELHNIIVQADKKRILEVAELTVIKGEVLVLLGPNGAGKSTLLQVAAGLKKPTSGYVYFSNQDKLSDLEFRRKVSTVFQSPLLLNDTVENNIASGLKFRGLHKKEIFKSAQYWMEQLHILPIAKRQAKVLSGGEAQRVSLARAFCLETELILMDEPFSALDNPTRQGLLDDLRNIFTKTNQTCIYVTHDLEEALSIGDRVAVLLNGKIHQLSQTQEVFSHPSSPEVAAFMGVDNIIPGKIFGFENNLLQIQAGDAIFEAVGNIAFGTQVYICLRPEDITLFNENQEIKPSSARNHVSCHITQIINQGPFMRVQLQSGFSLTALVTSRSVKEMELEVGKTVLAVFKASAIHLISSGKIRS
ncbi:MAG: ABC transporter ATP-binding protein [Anaerolinea sp.]|nr:ABC transporter ATP-binding protein [Anaerolinea sp.]